MPFLAISETVFRWYQWDPTKWWIMVLRVTGLARNLYATPAERIAMARRRVAALGQREGASQMRQEAM